MYDLMKESIWAFALRGIVALLFGLVVLVWPNITAVVFTFAFAILVLIEGAVMVFATLRHRHDSDLWPLYVILGGLGVLAGVYLLANPKISGLTLLFLIAAYAIARGVIDVVMGVMLRKEIKGEWLLIVGGLISIAFGCFIFAKPASGALVLLWLIAIYSMIVGVILLGVAFALDGYKRKLVASNKR